jgi:hypothetical protein
VVDKEGQDGGAAIPDTPPRLETVLRSVCQVGAMILL